MVQKKYFVTKNSTITIGSTQEQYRIMSDITLSGGEKKQVELDAIDGNVISFTGNQSTAAIEFDFRVDDNFNITEIVYGPETTTGSSPLTRTLKWNGAGVEKTITLAGVKTGETNNDTHTVTLNNVKGIECPITWTKGEIIIRHFKGIVDPSDITEQIEKYG